MMRILSLLLVSRFYKVNAGFFLFAFIILFGILPGPDTIRLHYGLMLAAVSSPTSALVAITVFTLYNIKCIAFTNRELGLSENQFLYNLQGLSNGRQLVLLSSTHINLYSPVLLYGLITTGVGFNSGHLIGGIAILLWQVVMIAAGTLIAFNRINTSWKKPPLTLPSFVVFKTKGLFSYLLHYSVGSKKGAFISIKIFSLLALQLLVVLNAEKVSKENICFLILLCIAAHSLLPSYYVKFVETQMAFMRNLPISIYKRLAVYAFTYVIILIPELLFLLYNEINVIPLSVIISLYVLAVSRLTLYSVIQYLPRMTMEKYNGLVFLMSFVTLILLASFSLWVFIVAEAVVAVVLFAAYYYRYQNVTIKEE